MVFLSVVGCGFVYGCLFLMVALPLLLLEVLVYIYISWLIAGLVHHTLSLGDVEQRMQLLMLFA